MQLVPETPGPLVLFPPSHPPLYLGIRPRELKNPELAQTASILPLSLWPRAWHVGLVQRRGAGAEEKQAVGLWPS